MTTGQILLWLVLPAWALAGTVWVSGYLRDRIRAARATRKVTK